MSNVECFEFGFGFKGTYRHNQSRLSTGHGFGKRANRFHARPNVRSDHGDVVSLTQLMACAHAGSVSRDCRRARAGHQLVNVNSRELLQVPKHKLLTFTYQYKQEAK